MNKYDFSYLIQKIQNADFDNDPFPHIYIEDFFSDEHFSEIIVSKEITTPPVNSDEELISRLRENGFNLLIFPAA